MFGGVLLSFIVNEHGYAFKIRRIFYMSSPRWP